MQLSRTQPATSLQPGIPAEVLPPKQSLSTPQALNKQQDKGRGRKLTGCCTLVSLSSKTNIKLKKPKKQTNRQRKKQQQNQTNKTQTTMYVEIFVSKKQRARPQGWALASTFHFPFCHSWFLHCIISCIASAQSGLISWKCKIKIKPQVSRWHSLCLSSPNPRALLWKWELVFPTTEWPSALEGSVCSWGRDETET